MFLVAANTRQAIVGQKEWITTGSSGIQVQFLFSDDWEGLSKFAVFRNAEIEESKIPIALTESNLTELPAENCAAEYVDEKVYVGVYGSDGLGHIIIPTIWVSLGVLKEGAAYEGMDPPQPTPDMWAQILAIAQNAGAENAEEAEKAADEAKTAVTHYPKIVDRYWYVWNAETETWVNTGIRAEGQDGTDGTSPTVTVTDIEGGHRVTITDEDHPQGQTFDVMDGQGGGTGDYDELTNRPRINGHTLTGNQSASDLGLGTYSKPSSGIPKTDLAQDVQTSLGKADTALQTAPVQSVAGKTGAVTLGAGDVGFSSSEEYNEGTVGAELSELNRHLSDKQNAPATAGTAGQVLGLDSNLNPTWMDQAGLNVTQKLAFLNCFEHVAWTDASGATYYDELYSVLINPEMIASISASYENEGAVYPSNPIDDLRQYITVTATYSDSSTKTVSAYTISGTLTVGSSVLTIGYLGKTATITVTVTQERKSDMDEWSDGVPYTDLEIVQNSYYNNGNPSNYNGWDRTGKFFVHGAAKIVISRDASTGYAGTSSYSYFFDENGQKVGSGFSAIGTNQASKSITIPSEAYYVGLSMEHSIFTQIIDNIVPYAE